MKKVAIIVVVIVVIASLGFVLIPGIRITSYTHVATLYFVDVTNDNTILEKTATLVCEVHTNAGNTYTASQTITLGPKVSSADNEILVYVPPSELLDGYTEKVYVR